MALIRYTINASAKALQTAGLGKRVAHALTGARCFVTKRMGTHCRVQVADGLGRIQALVPSKYVKAEQLEVADAADYQ
jgi:uncharacterized protein (AIM24 family)